MSHNWPRLTETLPHCDPGCCASCGLKDEPPTVSPDADDVTRRRAYAMHPWALEIWREHDESDKPEARYVVLCRPCSGKIIGSHPRLYARVGTHYPACGAMAICVDCKHRNGTLCTSPMLLANGGPGVTIFGPKPSTVHFYRKPPAQSGWEKVYTLPPDRCDAKETHA